MRKQPWYPSDAVATTDANGRDLGYAGPDGTTLYYQGFPVRSAAEWQQVQVQWMTPGDPPPPYCYGCAEDGHTYRDCRTAK